MNDDAQWKVTEGPSVNREIMTITPEGVITIVDDATANEMHAVLMALAKLYYEKVIKPEREAVKRAAAETRKL